MRILVVNCGSSSLKFQLIECSGESLGEQRKLARGVVDRIGVAQSTFQATIGSGEATNEVGSFADHAAAARKVLEWLETSGLASDAPVDAVGHRVVHGGDRFTGATVIDDDVIQAITDVTELAPLHNGPSLAAVRAFRDSLGERVPMVAAFDTTFHHLMPERAYRYAIPVDLADRHHIRRYGFHGIAHQYMAERYSALSGRPLEGSRIVTVQLGNGCSFAAIDNGRSIDTSMGLTPLEGLIMGTRSGDVDPALPGFIAEREGMTFDAVEDLLNKQSGLLGLSGLSRDMRELLEAEQKGHGGAALAIEAFCYRVRKYIGAYMAALGGANAIVFGGGIGEKAHPIRARICQSMEWAGVAIDARRNEKVFDTEGLISADNSGVAIYVIPVDEATVIARDTVRLLAKPSRT